VFTPENTDEELPPLNDNFQSMPEIKVTILGTEKLLKNLDPTKATEPDQIPARILKQFATSRPSDLRGATPELSFLVFLI
jgi:hypothetical protein